MSSEKMSERVVRTEERVPGDPIVLRRNRQVIHRYKFPATDVEGFVFPPTPMVVSDSKGRHEHSWGFIWSLRMEDGRVFTDHAATHTLAERAMFNLYKTTNN